MFNYIHKIIIPWGPLPLGCKLQVSNFKMKSHELGGVTYSPSENKHRPRCYCSTTRVYFANKNGYFSIISVSRSQVASSVVKCFHCTFTLATVLLLNSISSRSNIWSGSGRNSPYGSTYTTFQSTMWEASCTYLFNNETWKTSWTLTWGGVRPACKPLVPPFLVFQRDHSIWVPILHNSQHRGCSFWV